MSIQEEIRERIKKECPLFLYEKPIFPKDCTFNISPSQIDKFFTHPSIWYREHVLGEEGTFKGNTSTVIGTICHYIYEQITKGNMDLDRSEINKQLIAYHEIVQNPDINLVEVMDTYPLVASEVVNQYVLPHNSKGMLVKTELSVVGKVLPGIYVGGTVDRVEGTSVIDFKTVTTKPKEDSIPFSYKIQMLAYAYALRQQGYLIDNIRLVYGVKPTKTLGARCIVVNEPIDYIAEKLINDTLRLIAESVVTVRDNPKLAYLIFKSLDFKL